MLDVDAAKSSPFAPGLLRNQVAIVTGGGTGIGLAIAREMLELGARVALCGRRPEPLEAALGELEPLGHAMAHPCDVRDPEQIAAFVSQVLGQLGRIDILVNNAGGQFPSAAADLSPKGWEAVIRNNLNGTFFMTREVATRAMLPARQGAIVNIIANIARGFPGMAHTGAARAGVENLTRSLAIEWASFDVRVNAVAPGTIQTSGLLNYPPELVEMTLKRTPQKRLGTPEEVAHAVVYLSSPASLFITGATLYIDGGAALWGDTWQIPDRTA